MECICCLFDLQNIFTNFSRYIDAIHKSQNHKITNHKITKGFCDNHQKILYNILLFIIVISLLPFVFFLFYFSILFFLLWFVILWFCDNVLWKHTGSGVLCVQLHNYWCLLLLEKPGINLVLSELFIIFAAYYKYRWFQCEIKQQIWQT